VPAAASSPTAPEASASAALAEAQVRIAQLESELATLRQSPAPAPGLEELKAQLRDWEARYRSLEQEQEELLVVLARTEIENNNLKERLRLLTEKR
jgi:chromosome segregation ATPase